MADVSKRSPRRVWLLARPINTIQHFPASFVAEIQEKMLHLCHWAVLITRNDLSTDDIIFLALRARFATMDREIVLGTLYELKRHGNQNTARMDDSFGTKSLSREWIFFSSELIGDTTMSDSEIAQAGAFHVFQSLNESGGYNKRSPRV